MLGVRRVHNHRHHQRARQIPDNNKIIMLYVLQSPPSDTSAAGRSIGRLTRSDAVPCSAGPRAVRLSKHGRTAGSCLPRLPNRWLGIRAGGPRHSVCRLPRGDRRVGRAPGGGRGTYPHLTTRGVAGPSLHRRGLGRARSGFGRDDRDLVRNGQQPPSQICMLISAEISAENWSQPAKHQSASSRY
eukprot:COSAG01_NODE_1523_length_10022_cov_6.693339_3_plen_186_part_00